MEKQTNTEKKKCSYITCQKKAIGYFIGDNFGLYLCEKHKMGKLKEVLK